jgi:hypothetical protein
MTSVISKACQRLMAAGSKKPESTTSNALDDATIALLDKGLSNYTTFDPKDSCAAPFFWADKPHQVSREQAQFVS